MKIKVILFGLFWVVCSYINYGFTLGAFTNEFPDHYNTNIAVFMSLLGPLATPGVYFSDGFRHWRTVPLTKEESWEYFKKEFPDLSREEFERMY